jgi:hypothetical protein
MFQAAISESSYKRMSNLAPIYCSLTMSARRRASKGYGKSGKQQERRTPETGSVRKE